MDIELLKHASGYIEKMAKGINPLNDSLIPENDVLNNVRISRCLFYVNDVLKDVIEKEERRSNNRDRRNKIDFYLSKDDIRKYEFNDEDLSISLIVKKINNLINNPNMKKLKAVDVTNWLVSIGLLTLVDNDDKKVKMPTESGLDMGMYVEHRDGFYGPYDIVLYKRSMQEFIVDNFDNLLEYLNYYQDKGIC